MPHNRILPMAWSLTEDHAYELYPLYVPADCRRVLQNLAAIRAQSSKRRYDSVPVRSLDVAVAAALPETLQTQRHGWQREDVPYLLSVERADLSLLPLMIQDWVRAEFKNLPDNVVTEATQVIARQRWEWADPLRISLLRAPAGLRMRDPRFQAIADFLAGEFLRAGGKVVFETARGERELTFYRVARIGDGAELMSWPPEEIPYFKKDRETDEDVEAGTGPACFVIRFTTQTVPWRSEPVTYVQLSERRWLDKPVSNGRTHFIPKGGISAYVGTRWRLLDAAARPFSFIRLPLRANEQAVFWPRTLDGILGDEGLPQPLKVALSPSSFLPLGHLIPPEEVGLAYDSRLKWHPLHAGATPLDHASLHRAVTSMLPVRQAGTARRLTLRMPEQYWERRALPPEKQTARKKNEASVPMLRDHIVAPAAFGPSHPPIGTLAVFYDQEDTRIAMVEEVCKQLALAPEPLPGTPDLHAGPYGRIRIVQHHVSDLGRPLDVGDFSVPAKDRHERRVKELEARIPAIAAGVPRPPRHGVAGALVEIGFKTRVREQDPKVAWRLGLAQAGYVNQHLHPVSFDVIESDLQQSPELREVQKATESAKERVQRAVSDLLRQLGVFPGPVLRQEVDQVDPHMWLLGFWVLRRTRSVTADGKALQHIIMVRTDAITGNTEMTTPALMTERGAWFPYTEGLKHLTRQKWDPEATSPDGEAATREEEQLLNQFVTDCLRDCLHTSVGDVEKPRVLLMAEARNARLKLKWLQNPSLPLGTLPTPLAAALHGEEADRVWIARLRLAEGGEVPDYVMDRSGDEVAGGTTSGIFEWTGICDQPDQALYLSLGRAPVTAKHLAKKDQSRLDDGQRNTFIARALEIAPVYYPGATPEQVGKVIHILRHRWPYTDGPTMLPVPFHHARQASQYAISARDWVEDLDTLVEDEFASAAD